MPCPADDIHVRQAQGLRSIAHGIHATAVKVQRWEVGRGDQFMAQPVLVTGGFNHCPHVGDHRVQPLTFEVTKVQGHAHFARDHVA
ncbi:hypothetical protein D3C80_2051600 [compost metagenome]